MKQALVVRKDGGGLYRLKRSLVGNLKGERKAITSVVKAVMG